MIKLKWNRLGVTQSYWGAIITLKSIFELDRYMGFFSVRWSKSFSKICEHKNLKKIIFMVNFELVYQSNNTNYSIFAESSLLHTSSCEFFFKPATNKIQVNVDGYLWQLN
jgi:hypothetical protein